MNNKIHGLLPLLAVLIMALFSCSKEDSWDYQKLLGNWHIEEADPWVSFSTSSDLLFNTGDKVEIKGLSSSPEVIDGVFYMFEYENGEMINDYVCYINESGFRFVFLGAPSVNCRIRVLSRQRLEFTAFSDQRHFKLKRVKE